MHLEKLSDGGLKIVPQTKKNALISLIVFCVISILLCWGVFLDSPKSVRDFIEAVQNIQEASLVDWIGMLVFYPFWFTLF